MSHIELRVYGDRCELRLATQSALLKPGDCFNHRTEELTRSDGSVVKYVVVQDRRDVDRLAGLIWNSMYIDKSMMKPHMSVDMNSFMYLASRMRGVYNNEVPVQVVYR